MPRALSRVAVFNRAQNVTTSPPPPPPPPPATGAASRAWNGQYYGIPNHFGQLVNIRVGHGGRTQVAIRERMEVAGSITSTIWYFKSVLGGYGAGSGGIPRLYAHADAPFPPSNPRVGYLAKSDLGDSADLSDIQVADLEQVWDTPIALADNEFFWLVFDNEHSDVGNNHFSVDQAMFECPPPTSSANFCGPYHGAQPFWERVNGVWSATPYLHRGTLMHRLQGGSAFGTPETSGGQEGRSRITFSRRHRLEFTVPNDGQERLANAFITQAYWGPVWSYTGTSQPTWELRVPGYTTKVKGRFIIQLKRQDETLVQEWDVDTAAWNEVQSGPFSSKLPASRMNRRAQWSASQWQDVSYPLRLPASSGQRQWDRVLINGQAYKMDFFMTENETNDRKQCHMQWAVANLNKANPRSAQWQQGKFNSAAKTSTDGGVNWTGWKTDKDVLLPGARPTLTCFELGAS